MSSGIDATKPTAGTALTSDVRANFLAAKNEIEALQAGTSIIDGVVTDAKIGNRTPDEATTAVSGAGTLTQILGWFANIIKAGFGETHWYTVPGTTLKSHVANVSNPHGVTLAQVGMTNALIEPYSDAGGTTSAYTGSYTMIGAVIGDGTRLQLDITPVGTNAITAPTFNPSINGTPHGAKTIYKLSTAAVVAIGVAELPVYADLRYSTALTGWVLMNPVNQSGLHNEFRLTLTSGTAVTTADVTGAATVYCTPYKGNRISLYSGTGWDEFHSAEFSLALGTLSSGKPYDIFCYANAGVPTLEFLAWTNDTTRATALVLQDGTYVKSGAATRRYLGTFYTTAATTTEDSIANRYLWNYYNRVQRSMKRVETTASWTYTTATWRQANANTSNQLNFVLGVYEDAVIATAVGYSSNSGASVMQSTAIGLDSTSAVSADCVGATVAGAISAIFSGVSVYRSTSTLAAGKHSLMWLEYSVAATTTTWRGTPNTLGYEYPGISGNLLG